MGSLASLQDYDSLTAHAHPVFRTRTQVKSPFRIGRDPVARANQVLTGYLYAAGYARPARHKVLVELDKGDIFSSGVAFHGMSSAQTKLSLLTGFGIGMPARTPPFVPAKPEPALVIRRQGSSTVVSCDADVGIKGRDSGRFSLAKAAAQLRSRGVLGEGNRTDVGAGVFHSETGEILMDTKKLDIRIQAPRFEGVTIAVKGRKTLKHLDVLSSSSYGTVAVLSLDGRELARSRRLLLVYNTDALTEGDEFSLDRSVKLVWGKGDTLMKVGRLEATLSHHSGGLKLYALALNGERRQELPVAYAGGRLKFRLDTAELRDGPTPFFELSAH